MYYFDCINLYPVMVSADIQLSTVNCIGCNILIVNHRRLGSVANICFVDMDSMTFYIVTLVNTCTVVVVWRMCCPLQDKDND